MSLRVLLADESDTIKKVFQLALQDLNAEIKSVHSGLDVIDVAKTFKPDIVFADVLLQKKNGYDTCLEIKQNAALSTVPVVLMWSSFMELDQEQFKKSKADDQLEKPFDADFLRDLIKKNVPEAGANPMAQFLSFPKSITEDLKKEVTKNEASPLTENALKEDTSEFNLGTLTEQGAEASLPSLNFGDLSIPATPAPVSSPGKETKEDSWLSKDLSQFKLDSISDGLDKFEALNLGGGSLPSLPAPAKDDDDDGKTDDISIARSPMDLDAVLKSDAPIQLPPPAPTAMTSTATHVPSTNSSTTVAPPTKTTPAFQGISSDEIEAIVRAHTEEIIKTQVRDILVPILERVVRDELTKFLDEEVRLKQELSE